MKKESLLKVWALSLIILLLLPAADVAGVGQEPSVSLSHSGTALVDTTFPWPSEVHQAVSTSLDGRPSHILPGDSSRLILTSLDLFEEGAWGLATVIMRPEQLPARYDSLLDYDSLLIVIHQGADSLQVGIEGTPEFKRLIEQAPVTVIDSRTRTLLLDRGAPDGIPPELNLRWPWRDGETWIYTQGPHDGSARNAIDVAPPYAIPPADREVRAAARGSVVRKCVDGIQVFVRLLIDSNYATGYGHLDRSANDSLPQGRTLERGEVLGITYNARNYGDTCGFGSGPHLHFYVGIGTGSPLQTIPIAGTTFSGWQLGEDGCFTKPGQGTKCVGAEILSDNQDVVNTLTPGQAINAGISAVGEQDFYYVDGTANQDITLDMTRLSGDLDPYLILYRPDGSYLAYDDDGAGYPNSRLIYNLPETGRYRVKAHSWSDCCTGDYQILLTNGSGGQDPDDGRWLVENQTLNGTINPSDDEDWYYFNGVGGRTVDIRMEKNGSALDSYLELYDSAGNWVGSNDDGGGNLNSWLVATLPDNGVYRLKTRSYAHASSGDYTVRLQVVQAGNYALNKPAWASSIENGWDVFAQSRAFDGNRETRWSSAFSDPQQIYVDLEQYRTFDTVVLRWETAYGRSYGVYTWTGTEWHNVYWTNDGHPGTTVIQFPLQTSQYVTVYGVERGTIWGYSLWEFEVYNSQETVIPIVPPDDPGKIDPVPALPPLALPEQEQGKEIEAVYLGDGVYAQEFVTLPADDPGLTPSGDTGHEGLPTAAIVGIFPGFPGSGAVIYPDVTVVFSGSAVDNDSEGDPGIVAYEWQSDRDGLLSTQSGFTKTGAMFSCGVHVVSFRAQDNEGNWSDWDTVHLQVGHQVYLPLVMRNQ